MAAVGGVNRNHEPAIAPVAGGADPTGDRAIWAGGACQARAAANRLPTASQSMTLKIAPT